MTSERATTAQKSTLYRMLKKEGFVPNGITASTRTGPRFRALFKAAGIPEPLQRSPEHIPTWPTVDDWVSGLTIKQASAVLSEIFGHNVDR